MLQTEDNKMIIYGRLSISDFMNWVFKYPTDFSADIPFPFIY